MKEKTKTKRISNYEKFAYGMKVLVAECGNTNPSLTFINKKDVTDLMELYRI